VFAVHLLPPLMTGRIWTIRAHIGWSVPP